MAAFTFRVVIKATDKLWSVKFHPEMDKDLEIIWHRQDGFTRYTAEFTIHVTGTFDFLLIVGARKTTDYTYTISVKSNSKWVTIGEGSREIGHGNKDTVSKSLSIPGNIIPAKPLV